MNVDKLKYCIPISDKPHSENAYYKKPVGDFANIIDDALGRGTVKNVSQKYPAQLGYKDGDFDIVLEKLNISIKAGGATGATKQAIKENGQWLLSDKKYILFH